MENEEQDLVSPEFKENFNLGYELNTLASDMAREIVDSVQNTSELHQDEKSTGFALISGIQEGIQGQEREMQNNLDEIKQTRGDEPELDQNKEYD